MMGGIGSGRIRTLTDEDRKKNGTFRESESEQAALAKAAEKIIAGPWLSSIPEPSVPLKPEGRRKYDTITRLLFDQNKLTEVTWGQCELLAVMHQQMHDRLTDGKSVSADLMKRIDAVYAKLRIAENAPTLASPGAKNRFAGSGFSNSRSSAFRLRPHRPPDSGEL
jgi:hypothetical protein